MSEHEARIEWQRTTEGFGYEEYTRDHSWTFPNQLEVRASAAPQDSGAEDREAAPARR